MSYTNNSEIEYRLRRLENAVEKILAELQDGNRPNNYDNRQLAVVASAATKQVMATVGPRIDKLESQIKYNSDINGEETLEEFRIRHSDIPLSIKGRNKGEFNYLSFQ